MQSQSQPQAQTLSQAQSQAQASSQASKLFKSPVLVGLGVFAATLLSVVVAFTVYLTRASAADTAPASYGAYVVPTGAGAVDGVVGVVDDGPPPFTFQTLLNEVGLTAAELSALPRPAVDGFLPAGLDRSTPDDLLPLAATPKFNLTPGAAYPGGEPVLALEMFTNMVVEPIAARWTVTGQADGWVRVVVPVGRGALPSEDVDLVNHHAVWVPEDSVRVSAELNRVEISLTDRRAVVFYGLEELGSFHVGIGRIGSADTPTGLCSVVGRAVIQTGEEALLTSCQSEVLDEYYASGWSTIALHEGTGFSLTTGGAVSAGCIRIPHASFAEFLDHLPTGTPIIILP